MAKCIVTRNGDGSLKFTLAGDLPELDKGEALSTEIELATETSAAEKAAEQLLADAAAAQEAKQAAKPPKAQKRK